MPQYEYKVLYGSPTRPQHHLFRRHLEDGHNLRTQHGSGNLGTTVTLRQTWRRGRGSRFLLTWGTL
jgi:hypothetical protein